MSDNWITLIPDDPRFVPDSARQHRARDRLVTALPAADEIEIDTSEAVQFMDCGGNFERVLCPACRSDLTDWWSDRMDDDYDATGGFALATYATPCCAKVLTLHDLVYEWPQGFARFSLSAFNPRVAALDERLRQELEAILGTKLRVILRHL
ncbi:MAG: hypothetical protein K8T90_21010 [Planctomycetes bacterium]|nr:hypothetical protein [Planctomycetota bacterium]